MMCWRLGKSLSPCMEADMKLVVPLVPQSDSFSCGAACLEMLLRYYGAAVPRELKKICNPQDGLQPGGITAFLQKTWGHYTSAKMTIGILKGFLRDKKPVLCAITPEGWQDSHWVAVTGFTQRLICYADPSEGHQTLPYEKWAACWRDEHSASPWQSWAVTSWPQ